jgi:hypothetical protein
MTEHVWYSPELDLIIASDLSDAYRFKDAEGTCVLLYPLDGKYTVYSFYLIGVL